MLRSFSRRDEIGADLLVAHIVQQDARAFIDHHVGVIEFHDVGAGNAIVLARLIEHGGYELARQARYPAALRVDPDLDQVGALGGDLVDFSARGLRCFVIVAGCHGCETVHHREQARAADVAGARARLVLLDIVGVGRHAGGGGHAVERILAHLAFVGRRADMAVAVDNAGHDEFSGEVNDGGAVRRLRVAADSGDAAVLHDDGDAALRRRT